MGQIEVCREAKGRALHETSRDTWPMSLTFVQSLLGNDPQGTSPVYVVSANELGTFEQTRDRLGSRTLIESGICGVKDSREVVLSLLLGRVFYFLIRFGEETRPLNPIGTRPSIEHRLQHHRHRSRSSGKLPNFVSGVLDDPYRREANDVDDFI